MYCRSILPPARATLELEARIPRALDQRPEADEVRIAEQLSDHEPTPGPDDAGQLTERRSLIGNLSENGDEVGGVEAIVLIGKRTCVAACGEDVRQPLLRRRAERVVEHLLLHVED